MNGKSERHWRIGELSAAAGLSVRALRHYEQLGLLAPAVRSEGNQRVYDVHAVRRLYRICALRELGLSLAEIGAVLAEGDVPLGDVLRRHRDRVEAELKRLTRLRELLASAHAQVESGADPDVLATIEAMSRVARRAEPDTEDGRQPGSAEAHWRQLGMQFRAAMEAGVPPSAPQVINLARAARERIQAFGGGDRAVVEALAHLRRMAPPQSLAGWNPPLIEYLDQALARLAEQERNHG